MTDLWWKFYFLWQKTLSYQIVIAFFELLWLVLPYFLLGFLILILIERFIPQIIHATVLKKNTIIAVLAGAVLGVISPLGTYIAVPMCAVLLQNGYPPAPVFAFLLASPLINPNLFILTSGLLGPIMAVARTLSALLLGLAGGLVVYYFPVKVFRLGVNITERDRQKSFRRRIFARLKYVTKFFLLALLISAVVQVIVPSDWIVRSMGSRGGLSVFVAVGLGVPFYSCGGAAIPLIMVLQDLGMAAGPILAFFISGPATKLSTLTVTKMTLGWRAFIFYLFVSLSGAVFFGFVFGWLSP